MGVARAAAGCALDDRLDLEQALQRGDELGRLPVARLLDQPIDAEGALDPHRSPDLGRGSRMSRAVLDLDQLADPAMEDRDDHQLGRRFGQEVEDLRRSRRLPVPDRVRQRPPRAGDRLRDELLDVGDADRLPESKETELLELR